MNINRESNTNTNKERNRDTMKNIRVKWDRYIFMVGGYFGLPNIQS